MGRSPCCSKEGMNRGAWTAMEDKILTDYIKIHGEGKWRTLPKKAGLNRCGKSCRLRWLNYLRPDIKRGNITHDEEELIIRLHKLLGNRWSLIAGRLPGRTDNEIKNYWNTKIGKRLFQNNQQSEQSPISSHSQLRQSPDEDKPISPLTIQKSSAKHSPPAVNDDKNTSVVWTKASRCSKVILPHEQLVADHHRDIQPPPVAVAHNPPAHNAPCPVPHQFRPEEDDNFPDLTIDFEMDEQLLSDLLNTDFSEAKHFDHASDTNTSDIQAHTKFSPTSNQLADDVLFPDDTPGDIADFPSTLVATNNCVMDAPSDELSWLRRSI